MYFSLQVDQPLTSHCRPGTHKDFLQQHKKQFGSFGDGLLQLAQKPPPAQFDKGVYFDGYLVGEPVLYQPGDVRTKCSSCDNVYKCKTTLVRHWRQRHGMGGGMSCPYCGKRFGQKSNLTDHTMSCLARDRTILNPPTGRDIPSGEDAQVAGGSLLPEHSNHPATD